MTKGHFCDLVTVGTLCAQLTHDMLAIAKFLLLVARHCTLVRQHKITNSINLFARRFGSKFRWLGLFLTVV